MNYENHTRQSSVEEDFISIRRHLSLFISNWYWFVSALFIAGLIAYAVNTYSERTYNISASMLIKEDKTGMSPFGNFVTGGDIFSSLQNLQNEIGILKSYSLNLEVMRLLPEFHVTYTGLGRRGIAERRHYKTAPVIVLYDSLERQTKRKEIEIEIESKDSYLLRIDGADPLIKSIKFGERYVSDQFDFTINLKDSLYSYDPQLSNRYIIRFNSPETLANQYRSKLRVEPADNESTLIFLSVSGPVVQQEADYLNTLMDVYRSAGLFNKNEKDESSIRFINEQLTIISDSLKISEEKLENFHLSSGLFSLSSEATAILNRGERFDNEKINATLQLKYYDYLEDYILDKNELGEVASPSLMGVTDPELYRWIEELGKLLDERVQFAFNFKDSNPALVSLEKRISETRSGLLDNIKNSKQVLINTLNDIDTRIYNIEQEIRKYPTTERELIRLQREYELNNSIYVYMLEKRAEAAINRASNVFDNRIIDTAVATNAAQTSPRTGRNYLLAFAIALFLPAVYISLINFLNNKIIDVSDISQGTNIPVLGLVGHNFAVKEVPVITNPGSSIAESFRSLRTNLKYYLSQESKIISVTSTVSSEGKTFISTNLAVSFASLGKNTLIVELDMRKPKVHKLLETKNETGLSNYLIGEAELDSIINIYENGPLHFITAGPIPPNPAELIESERMSQFISEVKKSFDYIILDTPPVGIVTDGLLLSRYAALTLFVIRQRYTSKGVIDFIQSLNEGDHPIPLAIVANDIHLTGYYGYGLRYGAGVYQNYSYGQYGPYRNSYHKYYTED